MRQIEFIDEGDPANSELEVTDETLASKAGVRPWVWALPLLLAAIVGYLAVSDRAVVSENLAQPVPTTARDTFGTGLGASEGGTEAATTENEHRSGFMPGNEAERLGLYHSNAGYRLEVAPDEPVQFLVRSGSRVIFVDTAKPAAHMIELPLNGGEGFTGQTIGLAADKALVLDDGKLRLLSVNGGEDKILASNVSGFLIESERVFLFEETSGYGVQLRNEEISVEGLRGGDYPNGPVEFPLEPEAEVTVEGNLITVRLESVPILRIGIPGLGPISEIVFSG